MQARLTKWLPKEFQNGYESRSKAREYHGNVLYLIRYSTDYYIVQTSFKRYKGSTCPNTEATVCNNTIPSTQLTTL